MANSVTILAKGQGLQNYYIKTDEFDRELVQHGRPDFPIAGYDESFSKFLLGEVSWHWHEEFEIVVVYEGETRVETLGGETLLNRGEGILINANGTHRLTQIGERDCKILNFVFNGELLGSKEGLIYRKYIAPLCGNENFSFLKLVPGVEWQKEAIAFFHKAFEAYSGEIPGYELEVVSSLSDFWKLICMNRQDLLLPTAESSVDEVRLKLILKYIEDHYGDDLTVSLLASKAGISESECFRLFKRALKCTPMDYLTRIRLEKASRALLASDKTIQAIALESGFNSAAYFARKFRARYSLTPRAFRKEKG